MIGIRCKYEFTQSVRFTPGRIDYIHTYFRLDLGVRMGTILSCVRVVVFFSLEFARDIPPNAKSILAQNSLEAICTELNMIVLLIHPHPKPQTSTIDPLNQL